MTKLILSIICIFLVSIIGVYSSCLTTLPTGYDTTEIFSTPQNINLTICDLSNGHSCCSALLDEEIRNFQDEWTSHLIAFFNNLQGDCKGVLQGVSCSLCSQDQATYISVHNGNTQLRLCTSYCQEIFRTCGNARMSETSESVSSHYGTSYNDFCFDLFSGVPNMQLVLVNNVCWSDIPECTEDSYYSTYTQCVNGHRSLIYQQKSGEVCAGGVPLPSPVTGLPCDIKCPMGQYVSTTGCADCNPGTYSLGSALREDTWSSWGDLNIPFTTRCTETRDLVEVDVPNCGWVLGGFEITSGNLNSSQTAYLETTITLADQGTIAFDFKVDCEPFFDGLSLSIDHVLVMPKQSTILDFKLSIFNLTAGAHFVQFAYSKDQSISKGADRATINLVQFSPVNNANDFCEPCRPGRYQNQSRSSFCRDCPANTYSASGDSECTPCPAGYYSFEGSPECSRQEDCTQDDVYYLYGQCKIGPHNNLTQDQYPVWKTPHICNDHGHTTPPYPNITSSCVSCNPGEYRDLSGVCHFCGEGLFSNSTYGTNSILCFECGPGTAATKSLYIDYFDQWDDGLSTTCNYYCGTPGWELHNEYVSSGSGHGVYVNSILKLNTTLERQGTITFYLELDCYQSCGLIFSSSSGISNNYYAGSDSVNISREITYSVPEGNTLFQWVFTKSDPQNLGRYDAAKLNYILVTEVENGGAYECSPCDAGTYAPTSRLAYCSDCPEGTYSSQSSDECIACDDGYFSTSGSSHCIQCGEGTSSNSDHTSCEVKCGLTVDGYEYDLSPMIKTDDEMYGPIYDSHSNKYFLNICTNQHNNNTCIDQSGDPITTYACQISSGSYGYDIGNFFGIMPLRSNYSTQNVEGVTIHLTNGSSCINSHDGTRFPRQTYIDIVCNPLAGVGFPVSAFDGGIVEYSKCDYEFYWASLYGCHVCTEDDYTYITTKCDQNNKRYIQYTWIDNPKQCHSGVSLPDPIEIPCGDLDTKYCPPGQYLDLSTQNYECVDADPGFFTIGGGEIYNDWSALPSNYLSVGFVSTHNGIRSSDGYSYLLYLGDFVETGTIQITYKLFGVGYTGGFYVYLDNELYLGPRYTTDGVFDTLLIDDVSVGHHFIKIAYDGGVSSTIVEDGMGRGVLVSEIIVVGIYHAAEYQMPCPAGTHSPAASTQCYVCPKNTYSSESSGVCTECEDGYFSYSGSSECSIKEQCTINNYQKVYGVCNTNAQVRSAIYIPLQPFVCDLNDHDLTVIIEDQDDTIACDYYDCEVGEYRSSTSNDCQKCELGYYWNSENQKCSQSDPGYAGLLQTGFFTQPEAIIPSIFSTNCTGDCLDFGGWRNRFDHIDSGDNADREVDVYLELPITLNYDGSIEFNYEVDGDENTGVLFFINHYQQSLDYHPTTQKRSSVSFDLNEGENIVRWVYHQDSGNNGVASINNIIITGAGGSVTQIPCPPGSYSSSKGSNICNLCEEGHYAPTSGSTSCELCGENQFVDNEGASSCYSCGENTNSTKTHDDCETSCVYPTYDRNRTIDLNLVAALSSGPFETGTNRQLILNLCHKDASPLCRDEDGIEIYTYACQINNLQLGIDSGRILNVHVDENNDVTLLYTNGQKTQKCESVETEIRLHCNISNAVSAPRVIHGSTECHLLLQWDTAYVCPICEDGDYLVRESDCDDGQKTIATVRQTDCYGPFILSSTTETCDEPFYISLPIIVAVIIVFIILILTIVVIVIWNRKIHNDYMALSQKEAVNVEMNEMKGPEIRLEENSEVEVSATE